MIEIPLTQCQVALIDDEDFELVSKYKWNASKNRKSFYAGTDIRMPDGSWKRLLMHRLVMNAKAGQQVDHIHHLTLDNRKSELRLCTNIQNHYNSSTPVNNTSGYKGVSWCTFTRKWEVRIRVSSRRVYLGRYADKESAYAAYCAAAIKYHGEFACLN